MTAWAVFRCRSRANGVGRRCDRWRWHRGMHFADHLTGRDLWAGPWSTDHRTHHSRAQDLRDSTDPAETRVGPESRAPECQA